VGYSRDLNQSQLLPGAARGLGLGVLDAGLQYLFKLNGFLRCERHFNAVHQAKN
jgi:hypothetical protein